MPILYSTARAARPHDTRPTPDAQTATACPVCEGRTTRIVDVASAGEGVTFINKNLFPVIYPPDGVHFLQWTSNFHDLDLHNVSHRHLEVVLERLAAFEASLLHHTPDHPEVPGDSSCQLPHHGYVGIIKNFGRKVGGSLSHGHQQILHTGRHPLRAWQDMQFIEREGRSVATQLLNDPESRVIEDYGAVRLITPSFLRRPLQAMIVVCNTRHSYLHELTRDEREALALALRAATAAIVALMPRLGRETAYNLVLHNGPIGGLYLELLPWTQEYGGYEQQGLFICAGTPELSHQMYLEQLRAG